MKTVTIDCDRCWTKAASTLTKLKEQGKEALAALRRLKIVIEY